MFNYYKTKWSVPLTVVCAVITVCLLKVYASSAELAKLHCHSHYFSQYITVLTKVYSSLILNMGDKNGGKCVTWSFIFYMTVLLADYQIK